MSVESFKQFSQKVADDEAIREKVKEIGQTNVDGIIAYANQLGYSFTSDDMIATAKEAGVNVDELNEEQLEKVAGGVATATAVAVAGVVGAAAAVASAAFAAGALGIQIVQGVTKRW